jgi:hypothetical protein
MSVVPYVWKTGSVEKSTRHGGNAPSSLRFRELHGDQPGR